ncbi:hypothetical protein GSI_03482 [Ganoderma sinense ZZ0214-1]|uniref:Transporter n=1 Tax=Ganoderma sinense ZZ0214-1 TaxID=1077348 RepID=A0A2G8SLS2_9APHY|nr:hypothetical protein GSI_03482 [Ganoderma sinense ZZ0214-1]
MVAIKYVPIVAACLSLCTGVAASVIAERQVGGNVPSVDLSSLNGVLASPPSSSDERAVSNRAAAADSSPALTLGGTGNIPGHKNESHAVVALNPGFKASYDPVNGISLQNLTDITTIVATLAALLVSLLAASNTTVPVPAGNATGPLSGPLAQGTATIQGALPLLNQTLGGTGAVVPANVTDVTDALMAALGPILEGSGISPSDPVSTVTALVALLTGLVPVLLGLVAALSAAGH